eukprot:CAMPEP_0198658098 /NCGR_PEP_ID=MMETSP1467-20131203/22421_1 /TAXON_ID=1462469 /ORGANISM="unid. sp., Strain CCMP2135" /LENGTH=268 /DNA_ID=CAMNT_0044394351 /DNA_START=51 /DNA_END=857 /DNA_ORIENTATION=-
MATLFVAHGGGPMPILGMDPITKAHLQSVQAHLPEKPKAVLVVSAHWEADPVRVQSSAKPGMFFDYYGFPEESYAYKYDAPGSPELAAKVQKLLQSKDIPCELDAGRDYDHGVFVPMMLAFPEHDVPVLELSVHASLDAAKHLAIGAALKPLRDDGVLILGSGMSFHNMAAFRRGGRGTELGSDSRVGDDFDEALTKTLLDAKTHAARVAALAEWTALPGARDAHPREEHLLPLMVVVGAADDRDAPSRYFSDSILNAAVSAFKFSSS